jgi:hypothetical protein
MRTRLLLLVIVLIACSRSEPAAPNAPPRAHAPSGSASQYSGCYTVDVAAWKPSFPNSAIFHIPPRVQLTRVFVPEVPPAEPVVRREPYFFSIRTRGEPTLLGRWRVEENNEITLIWFPSPATVKGIVRRGPIGEDLIGAITPIPPNGSSAEITLRRVSC